MSHTPPVRLQLCLLLFTAALMTPGCRQSGSNARGTSQTGATLTCPRPIALPPSVGAAGSTTVFGELHGTAEAPRLFGDAVCAAARTGEDVWVGLELPSTEQAALDTFMTGPAAGDTSRLLRRPFWTKAYQDGRTSRAMLALLVELHRMRRRGASVRVFAFDVPHGENARNPDQAMAETLARHRAAHPGARLFVLTGNLHARKTVGTPWDAEYKPMAHLLTRRGVAITTLNVRSPAGTAWVCSSGRAEDCGAQRFDGLGPLGDGTRRGIRVEPASSTPAYDGVFIVRSQTASPPARP